MTQRMPKSLLMTASIAAIFSVAPAAVAADDAGLLKQAREIFKPLPADMATADSPITAPRVELGRMLFFDPRVHDRRQHELRYLPSACPLRNRRIAEIDRGATAPASAQ